MPARAASERVRGMASPAIVTSDAAALARNSAPTQRTPWSSETYCWIWTAASPASPIARSTNAAGTVTASIAPVRRRGSPAKTLVAIAAPGAAARGHRRTRGGEDVPRRAEAIDGLAVRVARVRVSLVQVQRVAVVGHLRVAVRARRRADLA